MHKFVRHLALVAALTVLFVAASVASPSPDPPVRAGNAKESEMLFVQIETYNQDVLWILFSAR